MKIRNIILFIVLGLVIAAGIYFLVKRASNNQANMTVFQAVPEEADGVMVLNIEAFMTLFFTNIGDVWELKDDFEGNNQTEEFSNELQLSGINLTRKIILYNTDNQYNVLVPITDPDKFEEYLQALNEPPLKSIGENQYYSSDLGGFIGFNDEICYLSQCESDEVELAQNKWKTIQNLEVENRELSPQLSTLANSDEHFSFFIKEDEMAERSPYFDHSPAAHTVLTFEDGLIRIKSILSTANSAIKNPLISGGQSLANADYMNMHLNLDPDADLSYWLSDLGEEEFKNAINEMDFSQEFIDSWQGNFNMAISGIETVSEEVVTYDFDDNFNKVEKTSIEEVKKLGYQISYTGEQTEFKLESLEMFGIRNGSFSSSAGSQFFTSNGNVPKTSTADAAVSLEIKPQNILKLVEEQQPFMALMAKPYTDLIDGIQVISEPNGQSIESETIIKMADSDKNSLIYLIGALQRGK